MVFPLRDSPRVRRRPWVTYMFVAVNVIAFLIEVSLGDYVYGFIDLFAVVPARVLSPAYWLQSLGWPLVTLFTSIFLHGSWGHLIGNMLYLWVFGDNVEDTLGHRRYIVFYLLCGLIANVAHVLANPDSAVPTIGASGAVAGVLGGYLLRFPRARVLTLIPIGFFIPAIPVRAWFYLVLWFLVQLWSGLAPIWAAELTQTVAFWAHISGFLAGFALASLLQPREVTLLPGR